MLRILYAGTPDFAALPLPELAAAHTVAAVLTNPPAVRGRKRNSAELVPQPTPVALAAEKLNAAAPDRQRITILAPEKLTEEVRDAVAALEPDIMVCFSYGKIFGPKFLSLFPLGAVNLHPSLLPRYRGASPVQAAILNGGRESGITVQRMVREMDAGDILLQVPLSLGETETSGEVLQRVGACGGALFLEVLRQIETGTLKPLPQDSSAATYCSLLKKEDGVINWNRTAAEIDAQIRAFSPWPGTFTTVKRPGKPDAIVHIHRASVYPESCPDGKDSGGQLPPPGTIIGIDKKAGILVQTGKGVLALRILQWETKKSLPWKDFLNGSADFIQAVLTDDAPDCP
ncbi:MAG: methionyl-tRNA formyltransferase [Spirochaetaceae bacterium]|jgi:methionyl-tRNA formyltransferase|nr:methionyl-tRNA formyltransferase [Spirochaetaceae bacterium]